MKSRILWCCSLLLACAATARAQEAPPRAARTQDRPIELAARDSLVIVFDEAAGDTATLTGAARIKYGDVEVDAHRLQMLLSEDELRAFRLVTDSGSVGMPTFKQGQEQFQSTYFAYNLRTERGRFQEARTRLDDGSLRARVVKVDEDSTLYVRDGIYTTCPCADDPSYSLRASQMKVKDDWIYTGPIQLYLFNIPTPLWLPFGVLPNIEGRRAGPLAPDYGEDERGFFLKDFGWYWPLSDYADLQVRGGFWTKGSWNVKPTLRYNRRYFYNGNLALVYGRNRSGEKTDLDFVSYRTVSVNWSHSQTFGQRASLNGNVNLSSQNYLRTSSDRFDDRVRQSVASSVNYNTRWPSAGRSLTLSLSQRQQLQTGTVDMNLPTLTLTQNERRPFRGSGNDNSLLSSVSFRYSGNLSNQFSFLPLADSTLIRRGDSAAVGIDWFEALFSPSRYRRATGNDGTGYRFRATHNVPISASAQITRLPLVGPIRATFVPSIDYREMWYMQTDRREIDSTGTVRRTEETGFFALRQFNAAVSMNTTIYGIFPLRAGAYDGLRHTVRPSIGFAYQPDFSRPHWGYTRTYRDAQGNEVRYPVVTDVRSGKVAGLTFNLENVFETRRVTTDTTGAVRREAITLLNVGASTAYNFAADSMRLSNINVNARSRLFGQVDVNLNSVFSPYGIGPRQSEPVFNLRRFRLARLTSLTLSASTRLQSRQVGESRPSQRATFGDFVPGAMTGAPLGGFDPARQAAAVIGQAPYADFSIPWSLSLDVSYGLSRFPMQRLQDGVMVFDVQTNRNATLNTSFDLNLTPNWKVQGRTGYDFVAWDISTSNLAILRDFDCWELAFNWVPFGAYQSYAFTLQVKSGKLRELLRLQQPRADVRGRFGGLMQ